MNCDDLMGRLQALYTRNTTPSGSSTETTSGKATETPSGTKLEKPSGINTSRLIDPSGTARSTPSGKNIFNSLVNNSLTNYMAANIETQNYNTCRLDMDRIDNAEEVKNITGIVFISRAVQNRGTLPRHQLVAASGSCNKIEGHGYGCYNDVTAKRNGYRAAAESFPKVHLKVTG